MRTCLSISRTVVGVLLLGIAACRPFSGDGSGLDPTPPLPSSALVVTKYHDHHGFGCLVDREHRLLLTSAEAVGGNLQEAEVIFPAFEDGKIKPRRDYYLKQAPRIAARVIATDPKRDLAVLQVTSVPDDVQPVKVAGASAKENDKLQLLVDPGGKAQAWFPRNGTARSVGDQPLTTLTGTHVVARLLETSLDGKLSKAAGGSAILNEAGELAGLVSSASAVKTHLYGVDVAEIRPFLAGVYRKLAETAIDQKDYTQAVALCDRGLALKPDDALSYNERGAALSWLNRNDEAIADYSKAIERDSALYRAYRNRASAYLHQEKLDQAVADCTAAIKINQKYVAAYRTRRDAYLKLKKADLARADQEAIDELTRPKVND
jgi:tetratricopeptide (TPR) repeat protein